MVKPSAGITYASASDKYAQGKKDRNTFASNLHTQYV